MTSKGCYFANFGDYLTSDPTCPLGFYCPNVIKDKVPPTQCGPSTECAILRLLGSPCIDGPNSSNTYVVNGTYGAMGKYEPIVCPPGYYCKDQQSIEFCPAGYFCPTGSIAPMKCDTISHCPVGSTAQVSFTGIVCIIILDVALALVYAYQYWFDRNNIKKVETVLPLSIMSQVRESVLSVGSPKTSKETLADNFRKSMNGRDLRMHFTCENLGLALPSGKVVLQGVSGKISAGKMTAIMGPSGAGKTTFLNVLCGKVSRTSGKLFISGKELEMQKYKNIYGFVPQEDIMHRELSVRENILHSARIRAPSKWSSAEIEDHVSSLIDSLKLKHVSHTLIGDGITRGVSGGQRKRVNIAIEVAATPLSLFLDEPTSGLDSTSSLECMDMLEKISRIGVTVVAVIHQPRVEIFNKFDDVLMIAPGGRTAYLGPTQFARKYFENLGYSFPVGANDADILMDILSGQGTNKIKPYTVDELVNEWSVFVEKNPFAQDTEKEKQQNTEFHELADTLVKERGANWLKQLFFAHNISLLQQYRNFSGLVLEIGVALFAGLILGLALSGKPETYQGLYPDPYTLLSPSPNLWLAVQLSLLIGLSIALAAAPAGVKLFSEELQIYWRNVASGHNPVSYYFGKTISSFYRLTLAALHYTAILYLLATPILPFSSVFLLQLLTFYGVYGLSSFVSMIVRRENATLLATVVALFSAVFCGYGLTIKQSKDWGIYFIWALQFNMWAAEANFSDTLKLYDHVYNSTFSNYSYGYTLNQTSFDYGMMFLLGSVWRILAFVAMITFNRDKQK